MVWQKDRRHHQVDTLWSHPPSSVELLMSPELQSGGKLHLEDTDSFESVCANGCAPYKQLYPGTEGHHE